MGNHASLPIMMAAFFLAAGALCVWLAIKLSALFDREPDKGGAAIQARLPDRPAAPRPPRIPLYRRAVRASARLVKTKRRATAVVASRIQRFRDEVEAEVQRE